MQSAICQEVTELRFNSSGARGCVRLNEDAVTCETTSFHGNWKTNTPYAAIEPHTLTIWHTQPGTLTLVLGLSAIGIICGAATLVEIFTHGWHLSWLILGPVVLCLTSFGLLIRVLACAKAEWIWFPTQIPGHRIAYIKTQKNRDQFEAFTAALMSRVLSAKQLASEEPAPNANARFENHLLQHLHESLRRLHDDQAEAVDVHHLVFASLAALNHTPHSSVLSLSEKDLQAAISSSGSREQQRQAALLATDGLQRYLASVLASRT